MSESAKQRRREARRKAKVDRSKSIAEDRRRREEIFNSLPGRLKRMKYWRKYRKYYEDSGLIPTSSPPPINEHSGSLKVVFVSTSDYAFMGYALAECLKSVGIKAVAASGRYSPLRPLSQQGHVYTRQALEDLVRKTYVIVWMHSVFTRFSSSIISGKKCVVFHGGTRYRSKSDSINNLFNPRVHLSLVQTGELLGRGARNERWLLPPVDTRRIKPHYGFSKDKKLVIGHFTSHPKRRKVKGSDLIQSTIDSLTRTKWKDYFIFKSIKGNKLISWRDNLRRMEECDIYIESLSQAEPRNRNRHDWSVQALEACALGCITITNFLFERKYRRMYGEHGLLVANSGDELRKILISLFRKDRDELLALKKKAREWVEEQHSYEVVGERLRKLLGI